MNTVFCRMTLLAQNTFFEDVSRRVRKPTSVSSTQWWIIGAALITVIMLAALASWHAERQAKPKRCNSPLRLFWSLCEAHGLPWRDRWALWQVSRNQKLADPARLFLEPQCLDAGAASSPPGRRPRLERLRTELFAGLDALADHATAS